MNEINLGIAVNFWSTFSKKILFTDKHRPTFDSPEYSPNTKHAIQQRMSWLKSIIGKYFVIPAIVNSVHWYEI